MLSLLKIQLRLPMASMIKATSVFKCLRHSLICLYYIVLGNKIVVNIY